MIIPFIENINFYELLKFIKLNESSEFNKDYIPVEYLQSDGNQYIITPFYYDQGWPADMYPLYHIKCKACINDNYSIFGRYQLFNLTGTSGKLRFYGYQESQSVTTDIDTGTILNEWELRDKNLYCNGIIQNETPDYFNILGGSGTGGYIYLFCRMYGGEPDDNGGTCKISNFYVSAKNPDTGTITEICDLVACIRKSDNKPGMYDKVSQTFLTNQGTGEFETPIYGYLSGNPPFTFNSNGNPLVDYTISGNTMQNSTPTPENPVIPQGTGERTGNLACADGANSSSASGMLVTWEKESSELILDGKSTASSSLTFCTLTLEAGTYTLSITGLDEIVWNKTGFYLSGVDTARVQTTRTYTVTEETIAKIQFVIKPSDVTYLNRKVTIMFTKTSTPLPYEPYGIEIPISSANTTTPVYLGEVETTRKIRKLVLTGTETVAGSAVTGGWIITNLSDSINNTTGLQTSYCSHYVAKNNGAMSSLSQGEMCISTQVNNHINFVTTFATVEDFKAYLAAQYAAGTPVCVWYVLAEPTTGIVNEPLMKIGDYADTVSKAQAGVEIPTINGSNTLTVDTTLQPSEVSIVYKK